jgi:hypothetical protein
VFGVIWNHFGAQSVCLTLDDFTESVLRIFRNSKLKIEFNPLVMQVPNWESILLPRIDTNFASGFKGISTQHQCKFI